MGMLSKKEKEELLKLSKSLKLREDFRNAKSNSLSKKEKINLDDYIKFPTITNALIKFVKDRLGHDFMVCFKFRES